MNITLRPLEHSKAIMMSYHGSRRNIHLSHQINHIHAEPAMINKRNPNEAQKQSDPPVSGDRQTAERCRASRDDSGGGGEISQRSGVAGH